MRRTGLALLLAACGSGDRVCDPADNLGCSPELACEMVSGAGPRCVTPLAVRGKVRDHFTGQPMAGARVQAVAEDGTPLAPAATSGADGRYEIPLHAPRDSALRPISKQLRLQAGALGHGSFPDVWRDWPTVDVASALVPSTEDKLIVTGADTDLTLIPFAGGPGRGVLSGHVDRRPGGGAALVVAEAPQSTLGRPRGTAAWVDGNGNYTLFSLPPGDLRVRAYARGASYAERGVTLNTAEQTVLDLSLDPATPAVNVSGNTDGGAGVAQVALVLESTWVAESAAGEEPLGLRVAVGAGGGFTIAGVPAGRYLLVSREVDGFVALGEAPVVEVSGVDVTVTGQLRLVPALALVAPGAQGPEAVRSNPTLSWADFDGEDHYQVDVLNAVGLTVLARTEPAHDGSAPAVPFDAPFVAAQLYRFRASAIDEHGAVLTKTEDRRGVFFQLE